MDNSLPDPPPLHALSPSLLTKFRTLSGGDVRTFKQVFIALWRWLWPISRFDSITLAYSLPDVLAQVEPSLTVYEWFTLCKLYVLTGGGVTSLNTRNFPIEHNDKRRVKTMMNHKLLVRTSFDPAHPHLVRPSHINKTYISFTPLGIRFYKLVVKELHRLSYEDSYRLTLGTKENARADHPPEH